MKVSWMLIWNCLRIKLRKCLNQLNVQKMRQLYNQSDCDFDSRPGWQKIGFLSQMGKPLLFGKDSGGLLDFNKPLYGFQCQQKLLF